MKKAFNNFACKSTPTRNKRKIGHLQQFPTSIHYTNHNLSCTHNIISSRLLTTDILHETIKFSTISGHLSAIVKRHSAHFYNKFFCISVSQWRIWSLHLMSSRNRDQWVSLCINVPFLDIWLMWPICQIITDAARKITYESRLGFSNC